LFEDSNKALHTTHYTNIIIRERREKEIKKKRKKKQGKKNGAYCSVRVTCSFHHKFRDVKTPVYRKPV
jgi:hypothetical protein